MRNELFSIGPLTFYGYGLMIAIGVIAAYIVGEYRAKKKGMDPDPIFYYVIWCVLGGFTGSKLLYFITDFKRIMENPQIMFSLAEGWVVYGGILGGLVAAAIYSKIKKLNFLAYFDLIIPSVALAQGFGRIGCVFAGCCYGMETDSHFGMTFTDSLFAPNGINLVPIQMISSLLNFGHFFLLILLARRKKADGQIGAAYLIFYSIGRFIIEFYRGDLARGSVGTLSTSQFISIFTLLGGIAFFVICTKKKAITQTVLQEESSQEP